jgi:ribulose-5-phosphate 4-epimerase/fuculose-1-phosphate aldolase
MIDQSVLQQARVDLAVALRAAARFGLSEGVCNHFSLAAPGRDGLFLINPRACTGRKSARRTS